MAEFENNGTDGEAGAEPGAGAPSPFQISFGEVEYEAPENRGETVNCTNCGYPNQAGRGTCWQCGTALDDAAPTSSRKKVAPGATGAAKRRAKAVSAATPKKPTAKKPVTAAKSASSKPAPSKPAATRAPRAVSAPAPVAKPVSRLVLVLGSVGIIGGYLAAILLGRTSGSLDQFDGKESAAGQYATLVHNQTVLASQLAANNTMLTVGFAVSAVVALAYLFWFGRRRG